MLKLCDLPAPYPDATCHHCPTVVIDLRAPEDELWQNVQPATRKLIRQARRDGIAVSGVAALSEEFWLSFLPAYRKLLGRKRNAGALGVGQISELAARNLLGTSVSCDANGRPLSWHIYACRGTRARLLSTVSDIDPSRDARWNNLVGRAHRLHHWHDILAFRDGGFTDYDFGGVYRGTDDSEQINIARFKTSFGGTPADTYDAVVPLTWKGWIARALVAKMGAKIRAGGTG